MKNFPFTASISFNKRTLTPIVVALALAYAPLGQAQTQTDSNNVNQQTSVEPVAVELDFTTVDLDKNGFLNWAEIEGIYGSSLSSLAWDRDKVFAVYDTDVNEKLDKNEFGQFISQLQRELEIQMK